MDKETAKRHALLHLQMAITMLEYSVYALTRDEPVTDLNIPAQFIAESSVPLKHAFRLLKQAATASQFPPGGISTGRADEFIISPTDKPREFSFSAKIDADKLNSVDFDFYSAANLMGLKTKLDEAVKAERFEEAAELRDKIEQIKGKQNG